MKRNLASRIERRIERCLTAPRRRLQLAGILRTDRLTLPHFLGIGAQKSGTTWLHENLVRHPELYLPEEKELHYFDRDTHKSFEHYAAKFASGRDRVRGEITPAYSVLSRDQIAYARRLLPEARLLFLMRNPIDRAWSQAVMNLVKIPKRRFEDVSLDEFVEQLRLPRTTGRSDYRGTLARWREFYPEDRFLIGFYEEISENPRDLLLRTFRHLGVSADVDWDSFPYAKVIYEGEKVRMPDSIREMLTTQYRDAIRRLAEDFDGARRWL